MTQTRIVLINRETNFIIAEGQRDGDEVQFDRPVHLEAETPYLIRPAMTGEQAGTVSQYEQFLAQQATFERYRLLSQMPRDAYQQLINGTWTEKQEGGQ